MAVILKFGMLIWWLGFDFGIMGLNALYNFWGFIPLLTKLNWIFLAT
jgi:hypothetical protein